MDAHSDRQKHLVRDASVASRHVHVQPVHRVHLSHPVRSHKPAVKKAKTAAQPKPVPGPPVEARAAGGKKP